MKEEPKQINTECDCMQYIDKAEKVGRATYRCKYCKKDVSVAYFYFQEALNKGLTPDTK